MSVAPSPTEGGAYPHPTRWAQDLIAPLDRTAPVATGARRVALGGSYRSSTAFAIDWLSHPAIGFEIEIPTRERLWQTDDRPQPGEFGTAWRLSEPASLDDDQLVVNVGVQRDPCGEMPGAAGASGGTVMSAHLSERLTSARAAGERRRSETRRLRFSPPRQTEWGQAVHRGSGGFGRRLEHRWNAMPPRAQRWYISAVRV